MAVVFTVEDGTLVDDANSYVTVDYANDYLSIKSNADDWLALDEEVVEKYLMWGTRLLDQRAVFPNSTPTDEDQALRWPRQYAYDRDGEAIPDDVIPDQIQEATVEIAFNLYNQAVDPSQAASSGGAINKIKVAVIEIGYSDGVAASNNNFPSGINEILYPLGSIGGAGGSRGVPIRKG